jgi:TRAP-type uncharacterized transport system fused permease subunit
MAQTLYAGLIMPMRPKDADHIPWYDYLLAVITFCLGVYVFANSWEISQTGWIPAPTTLANIAAIALCLIALEGGRRMAGIPFTLVCLFFFLYPMFADYMPGMLWGMSFSPQKVVSFIVYGSQGMLGLPGMVMGDILIGFLLFAGILIASGGGKFFLDFSVSLFGRFRGGPAKVAVMGSGLFGSLSGSPISNIAGANPMKTAWAAVRLGVVLLFIPFFFVFNPALVLRGGTIGETIYLLAYCVIGIAVLAGGLEGYLIFFGRVAKWARPLFIVGGFFIAYPDTWKTAGLGFAVTVLGMVISLMVRSREPNPAPVPSAETDKVTV